MGRTYGSGQGSVYKRGNKWRGQITINGKRLSHTADKKKDVLDWMANIRSEASFGFTPQDRDYTVREWMEIYFVKWYKPRVTKSTYDNTYNLIKNHLYPVLGDYLLKDLNSNIIQDAYPKMWSGKTYSDGTIKIFSSAFRQCLVCAQNEGIIKKNPHYGIVVPKTGKTRQVDAYTAEEFNKIIEYTKDKTDINRVFYLLAATGIRVGECIALTWEDVDLNEGTINITKTAVNQKGHMVIQDHPKTEQSVRQIYIAENTADFLRRLYQDSDLTRKDLVFTNEHGNLYHTSALRSRWVKVCAEIGIPYKNLHALRHSWATRAIDKKVEVHTVSKMLGHKSIATTMDIYKSVFAEQKKEAAKIMNEIV